ncbi:MAG: hypothetical protein QGH60_13690 [Phycisphaerae bacterium]|jgi:hypothetical protein|nr:hypothetical protein [Phycisphaerae bacterium]
MSIRNSIQRRFCALAATAALLSVTVSLQAASTGIRSFYIDEAAVIKGDCKIEVQNEWDPSYKVTLSASTATGEIPQDFKLLDGTLEITADIPSTELRRLRVRIRYDSARLRTLGGRLANPPTLLRLRRVGQGRRWKPIREIMELRGLRGIRKSGPATFELGHHGTDWNNKYVWAVVDTPGTFAIGVPEPISLLCLAGGIGVLALRRTKRRKLE